ncbi:unnamed protein product [Urochloa humidicola]
MAAAAEPVLDVAGAAVKKKKKTRLVLVRAEDIKELEARGPCPLPCFRSASDELRMCPAESFEEQALLDSIAEIGEGLRAMHDKETAILEQYREYGYAYEMVEDSDEEA